MYKQGDRGSDSGHKEKAKASTLLWISAPNPIDFLPILSLIILFIIVAINLINIDNQCDKSLQNILRKKINFMACKF